MVQEVIPGDDDQLFGYLAFWDANGKERAWVCKRKLRQYPPHFGNGSLQVTVDAPEVAELSRKFLHALGYKGFVGVEWKRDARDGTLRLMEINPRVVSGNQIAISAGVDFPWIAYRYLCDGDILDREVPYARGVKYVHEQWDIDAFRALRAAGELRFAGWLGSLRGTKAFAIWAVDDPAPFLAMVWESLRAVIRRISAQMRRS
jgi:predicted ATP-grasp superfamily ATP-dependent carboligase